MPRTEIFFYKEGDHVPVLEWLEDLLLKDRKAFAKCRARIDLLEQEGHQLRRPVADYLRDGIYELALERKKRFVRNPKAHTHAEDEADG